MEHSEILELYLKKDPRAIEESRSRYGYPCRRVAMNILAGEQEAESCLSAALERAWESIPPARPVHLDIYILKLTTSAALEGYFASQSA